MTTDSLTPDARPLTPDPSAPWSVVPPLAAWQRVMLLLVGLTLAALLMTAACLPPNPQGMGTHQRLGLPPCSFILWFGQRCPACGMTTSWAHLMRGHVLQSAHANTGGMLLALYALALAPWMITSAVRGRWWLGPIDAQWILLGGSLVFLVTTAQWCWRVFL